MSNRVLMVSALLVALAMPLSAQAQGVRAALLTLGSALITEEDIITITEDIHAVRSLLSIKPLWLLPLRLDDVRAGAVA
jgi:hypothetical protein